MNPDHDPVTKLPKLNTSVDYILWKGRVHAYLRRDDHELIGLSKEADTSHDDTARAKKIA